MPWRSHPSYVSSGAFIGFNQRMVRGESVMNYPVVQVADVGFGSEVVERKGR